jgi:hypothetical protein
MKKLKEFKIALGGCFPAKSKAVRQHAKRIGYRHVQDTDFLNCRYLSFSADGHGYSEDRRFSKGVPNATLITAEKFLELTAADVVYKEPQKITITKEELEIAVRDVFVGTLHPLRIAAAAGRLASELGFTDDE